MPPFTLSHVALVVASLASTRERLADYKAELAAVEEQPTEQVLEQYVGLGRSASLLLCQPMGESGPYARARARRGPGLHHIGISVPDLDSYLVGLAGSGWYVLPQAVRSIARGTTWLARPGVQTLVEVCAMPEHQAPPFVTLVEVAMPPTPGALLTRLGLPDRALSGVARSPDHACWLTIGGQRFAAAALASA